MAADIEAVEAVSEILTRFAPGGTSVEPGFGLTDEGLGAVVDPTRPAIVRAYLPGLDPAGVEAAIAEATTALGHLQAFGLRPIGELQARLVREADWAEAWKSHFPVLRVGRRMVIRPTWRRHRRLPGDVVLSLDPGMAFGTGLHPTTRLCLAALETLADEGLLARGLARGGTARVIDVGCGSGILAIAAGKLGAGEILGVDTDPIAVESTLANARLNRLDAPPPRPPGQRSVRRGPLRPSPRQPDRLAPRSAGGAASRRAGAGRPNPRLRHLPRPGGRRSGRLRSRRTAARPALGRGRLGRPGGDRPFD